MKQLHFQLLELLINMHLFYMGNLNGVLAKNLVESRLKCAQTCETNIDFSL